MRIAVVLRKIAFDDGVGGMERAAAQHIEMITSSGHEVVLFTPRRFIHGIVPSGVSVIDIPWPSWNKGTGTPTFGIAYALWVKAVAAKLSDNRKTLDIVHLHGASAGVLKFLQPMCPTVVNPHGMEEFARATLTRLPNRLILRKMCRQGARANAVIATDTSLVPQVVRNIGAGLEHVVVIPNSVDVKALRAFRYERLESQRFTIVSVGRMVPNKGYDLLLEALRDSATQRLLPPAWEWVHFGSGPEASTIATRALSEPFVNLTILAGRSDAEVQARVSTADLFVQPSRNEGSSLTTLEAMAHGIKIVGTPVGGIPDKIRHGDTGYLAKTATASDIALAIQEAIQSNEDVGGRALHLVETEFSSAAAQESYLKLYKQLIAELARKSA